MVKPSLHLVRALVRCNRRVTRVSDRDGGIAVGCPRHQRAASLDLGENAASAPPGDDQIAEQFAARFVDEPGVYSEKSNAPRWSIAWSTRSHRDRHSMVQ
jgi:hypothetical protein